MYKLVANTTGKEVNKPRFSLGGAHSSAGPPTGLRVHLFTQHSGAPYSGVSH